MADIAAIIMAAASSYGAYAASQNKPPKPKTAGAPPTAVDATAGAQKKRRQYRSATQMFGDEELRLGSAGRLGL
ncbi:MAG: hypothetical protein V2A79_10135 [Planctomycetota bacterium]